MNLSKQLFITFFTLSIVNALAQAPIELERIKVSNQISIKLPTTFVPMSPTDLASRYVSAKPPLAMYTSQDQQIDIGINVTRNTWQSDDLAILKDFYKANIMNLFTEVDMIQETTQEIGGRTFIVFEFVSKVVDEENAFGGSASISKYTYIQYTVYKENVLLFNFTSPTRLKNQWQKTAKEIMESVRIK